MKYGQLEIPEKLVDAQEKGNLVIFAGAGVSIGEPVVMPDFNKLVKQICTVLPYAKDEPIEKIFGRHFDYGIDVHSSVCSTLKKKMNEHKDISTELHKNIPRLFKRGDANSIRIVTTNFDTFFSRVLPEEVKHYSAPALPLGGEFDGLVHLHGSIDESNSLILTDKDFAKAYMTQGWGREFVLNLYERYTIVFIGYSHNDQLISYIARGMNLRDKDVYAFSGDSKSELLKWDHLGIKTIPFPNKNFIALEVGIKKWADEVQSNYFTRRKRFNDIVKLGVPVKGSENEGFLKKYLMTPGIALDFTKEANSIDWCTWVIGNGLGDFIHDEIDDTDHFSALSPWNGSKYHLGNWLVRHFIGDVNELKNALARNDHKLSWPFAKTLINLLGREETADKQSLGYLCTLLFTNCTQVLVIGAHTELLEVCVKNGAYKAALIVLRELLKPRVEMNSYHPSSQENTKLDFNFSSQMLLQYCFESDQEFIKTCSREIFDLCINALQSIDEMKHGVLKRIKFSWIQVKSVACSNDSSHRPLASISCIAVKCMKHMLDYSLIQNPLSLATYLVASQSPIVRRIAVHLVTIAYELDNSDRINWLQSSGLIFSYPEYHEVFLLIRELLSGANEIEKSSFLRFIDESYSAKMDESEGNTDAYLQDYNIHLACYLNESIKESEQLIEFCQIVQGITERKPSRPFSPEFPTDWSETAEFFKSEFKLKPLNELIQMASSLSIDLKTEYVQQLLNIISKDTTKALEVLKLLSESKESLDVYIAKVVLGSLAANHLQTDAEYRFFLEILDSEVFFYPFHVSEIFVVYSRVRDCSISYKYLLIEFKICKAFWAAEKSRDLLDSPYSMIDENTALSFMSSILCRIVEESDNVELTNATLQLIEDIIQVREECFLPLFYGLGIRLFLLFENQQSWTMSNVIPLFSPSYSSKCVARKLWEGFFRIVNSREKEMELLQPALIESLGEKLIYTDARNFHLMLLKRLFVKYTKELAEAMVVASDDKGLCLIVIHLRYSSKFKEKFDYYWNTWVKTYLLRRLQSHLKPIQAFEFREILLFAIENPTVYKALSSALSIPSGEFRKGASDFVKACEASGFHRKEPELASLYLSKMVSKNSCNNHEIGKIVVNFIESILRIDKSLFKVLLPILEMYGMAGVPEAEMVYSKYGESNPTQKEG